jgi:C_GCAxxG_C_C family probable redox protein
MKTEDKRITLKQETVDRAFELAKKYSLESTNCAQSVTAAVFETLGVKNDDIVRAATGFASGVGETGYGDCGALSGGTVAISYLFGRGKQDFRKREKMIKSLSLSKKLHNSFVEQYGDSLEFVDMAETHAAARSGLQDKCSTLTGEVARLATRIILEEREGETLKEKEPKPYLLSGARWLTWN